MENGSMHRSCPPRLRTLCVRAVAVRQGDAAQPEAWGPPSGEPAFVLALEVLDNLPHDRWAPCPVWFCSRFRVYYGVQGYYLLVNK